MSEPSQITNELTPVDDVRRVREAIDAEFGGDVYKIADHANKVAEEYFVKLNLKLVSPPPTEPRNGTGG